MTCDEYRERWRDREPAGAGQTDETSRLAHHRATCPACAAWEKRQRALDEAIGAALVVSPPPELAIRLAQLPGLAPAIGVGPAGHPANGGGWTGSLLELVWLMLVGLSAIGLSGVATTDVAGPALVRLGEILQALTLLVSPPLLAYAQTLALTMTEAMATLVLLAMILLRSGPRAARFGEGEAGE